MIEEKVMPSHEIIVKAVEETKRQKLLEAEKIKRLSGHTEPKKINDDFQSLISTMPQETKEEEKPENLNHSHSILMHSPRTNELELPYINLATVPLTEMTYLIKDFIPSGYISMLYGDGGNGKSYLALYLAVLIATGRPFLNNVVKQGKVLYLDFELNPEDQRRRLEKTCKGLNINPSSLATNLLYLSPGNQDNISTNLTDLISAVKKEAFDLVVIDSIGAALTGDAEAAKDICKFFQQLRSLGSVLLLDHQAKSQRGDKASEKTPFGSVYKTNLSRNVWHINALDGGSNRLNCLLKHKKSNFSALHENIGLSYSFEDGAFRVEECEAGLEFSDCLSIKELIFSCFNDLPNATAKDITEETGLDINSVKPRLSELTKAGKLEKTGDKKDGLTVYKKRSFGCIPIEQNANADNKVTLQLIKETFNATEIPEGVPN